jgi:hypothetical protein
MNLALYLSTKIDYLGLKISVLDQYVDLTNIMYTTDHMNKISHLMKLIDEPVMNMDDKMYIHVDLFPHLLMSISDNYALLVSKIINSNMLHNRKYYCTS